MDANQVECVASVEFSEEANNVQSVPSYWNVMDERDFERGMIMKIYRL